MNQQAKKIISDAWHITNNHKILLKYGFLSSLFSILFGGGYLTYQINAFKHSKLFGSESNLAELFSKVGDLIAMYPKSFVYIIVLVIIVILGYFIVPLICSGAMTHLVAKIYKEEKVSHGVYTSITRLLPMIETSAVKGTVKPLSFFTEWSFVIRNLGTGPAKLLSPVLIFLTILGALVLFLFVFTTPLVIVNKNNFSQSMLKSTKLVLRNFGATFSLFLFFLLIELRVVLNVAVIILLPITILAITGLFQSMLLANIGIVLAMIVAVLLITLAAFITGTLSVFSHAIWTIALIEFQKEEIQNA